MKYKINNFKEQAKTFDLIFFSKKAIISNNFSVVYVARDRMILMRANPFQGPLKGVGP
jgi:hypothetical protein